MNLFLRQMLSARILLIGMVFILLANPKINAQTCVWARGAGGSNNDVGQAVTTDANGNVYVTGFFESATITFGATTLTNDSSGTRDMYVVKYDTAGNVVWAVRAGGTGDEYANSIAVDAIGNVYVAGSYNSSSLVFGSTVLTNAGGFDIFLVKYDLTGNVVWAKGAGSSSDDDGRYVGVDVIGNVYITGGFSSATLTFGTFTLTNFLSGSSDIYLAKFDASGIIIWARSAGGNGYDDAWCLAIANTGNIYVTGYFYSNTLVFGATTLTKAGEDDMYLVNYDTSGNVVWAKSVGDTAFEFATSVAVDATGKVLVTGGFDSPVLHFGGTTLISMGGTDVFTAMFAADGSILWAKSAGGASTDRGYSVTTDLGGNSYVAGFFNSATLSVVTTTLTNSGVLGDAFLIKYDNAGNLVSAKGIGGIGDDEANSVTTDNFNHVYITGYYKSPTVNFGSESLTNVSTNADVFLAKYIETPVRVEEVGTKSGNLLVYPNPSNGHINIAFLKKGFSGVVVYDSYGRMVYTNYEITGDTIEINLTHKGNGVYYLKTFGGGEAESVVIVVSE